jgi:hypothetical protein
MREGYTYDFSRKSRMIPLPDFALPDFALLDFTLLDFNGGTIFSPEISRSPARGFFPALTRIPFLNKYPDTNKPP